MISSHDIPVVPGSFSIDIMDENGNVILTPPASSPPTFTVNVGSGDSLADIASAIDAHDNISAQVVDGRLRISATGNG